MGVAARGDFDLTQHSAGNRSMEYHDVEGQRKYIPHVIEPSFGLDRYWLFLIMLYVVAILTLSYPDCYYLY